MDSHLLLNGMLPPSEKYAQNLKANEKLRDTEKELLYQIVDDCQKQESVFNVNAALDTIASSFSSCFGNGKEAPFLIKQVIFCIAVNCLKYNKKSQKDILDYLVSKGVSITHIFLQDWAVHRPCTVNAVFQSISLIIWGKSMMS